MKVTVVIKKFDDKQRRGKGQRIGKGRRKKELKIQRFLLTGESPYVKEMEKKGR